MRIFTLKAVMVLLTCTLYLSTAFGQTPNAMSYQAVIRNSSDALVTNTQVGMQISILQGSETGTAVYVETQTPTTNTNGLVSIEIGNGTFVSGDFATIDWANGLYFIKTETDPSSAGGTDYTITGTNQLLSVPYALHAKTAESLTGTITNLTIGQSYQGGIIFWLDATGQHGLISATADHNTEIRWNAGTNTHTMAFADGIDAGKSNTDVIIANQGYGDASTYAARVCHEYTGGNYGDWYLPSKYELNLLYLQKNVVGGFTNNAYWSSTEFDTTNALYQDFSNGNQDNYTKMSANSIRAIRAF